MLRFLTGLDGIFGGLGFAVIDMAGFPGGLTRSFLTSSASKM